jgi:hypothetical protein
VYKVDGSGVAVVVNVALMVIGNDAPTPPAGELYEFVVSVTPGVPNSTDCGPKLKESVFAWLGFVTISVPVKVMGSVSPSTVTFSITVTGKLPERKPESPTWKVPVCSVNSVPIDVVSEFAIRTRLSADGLNVSVGVPVIATVSAKAGSALSPNPITRHDKTVRDLVMQLFITVILP